MKEEAYKQRQEMLRRANRTRVRPLENYSWNPLLKLPRNGPCPCGSGRKLKLCHLDKLPRCVPTKDLPMINAGKFRLVEDVETKMDELKAKETKTLNEVFK